MIDQTRNAAVRVSGASFEGQGSMGVLGVVSPGEDAGVRVVVRDDAAERDVMEATPSPGSDRHAAAPEAAHHDVLEDDGTQPLLVAGVGEETDPIRVVLRVSVPHDLELAERDSLRVPDQDAALAARGDARALVAARRDLQRSIAGGTDPPEGEGSFECLTPFEIDLISRTEGLDREARQGAPRSLPGAGATVVAGGRDVDLSWGQDGFLPALIDATVRGGAPVVERLRDAGAALWLD